MKVWVSELYKHLDIGLELGDFKLARKSLIELNEMLMVDVEDQRTFLKSEHQMIKSIFK